MPCLLRQAGLFLSMAGGRFPPQLQVASRIKPELALFPTERK
jgi:hypothetical protein